MKAMMKKLKLAAAIVAGAYMLGVQAQSTCDSRPIAFGEADRSSGRLTTIQVTLASMFYARGELYLAYDAEDKGSSFSAWAVREKVKDVTEADTTVVCPVSESWGQSGYRAMRAFLVSSELKDGDYAARLEWIENADKANSYVNTKMVPNVNSHVESRFRRTTDDGQIILYGAGGQTITAWMGKNTGLNWRFGTAAQTPEATKKDLWYDFVQDANGVQFVREDGTTKAPTKYTGVGSLGSSPIYLFRNGTDTTYSYSIQMGYWRYSEGGEVLADFIPCQLNDGSTGIWDLVSKSALTLSGTFNAGPAMTFASGLTDVTPEAYLFTTVDTPEIQHLSVSGDAGSVLAVAGRIVVASGDVKNATFRLVYSTSPQLEPAAESSETSSDENGDFAFEVSGVDPATKYYCRLNVKGESGGVAQSDVVEVTTKGASTMNWKDVTTTADQRIVTYSGTLSEQGVKPTYILLKRDSGEIVGQSVCDDAGNWSITVDISPWKSWKSSGVSFTHSFVCSNDCPGRVFVSASANLGTEVKDLSRYTWTGQGATANWSDTGNWSSDQQDCVGFPSSLGGHAVFPDETVAEIIVDQNVNCTSIAQGARKVKLRFVAEESYVFGALTNFVNDSNDATSYGSEYVFSGPVTLTGFITTGMDNLVRAEKGAKVNGMNGKSVYLALQDNETTPYRCRLELLSGAKFTNLSGEFVINGEAEVVVDDSTFEVGVLVFNCWATGGHIRLRGSSPKVIINDTLRSQTGREIGDGGFIFELPREGYEKPPITFDGTPKGGDASNDGSFGKNAPIHWTIDTKSPLFGRTGTHSLTLAEVSYAFPLDRHIFDRVPGFRRTEFVTDLEADPKTISFHYTKQGLIVFMK